MPTLLLGHNLKIPHSVVPACHSICSALKNQAVAGSDWLSALATLERLRHRGMLPDRPRISNGLQAHLSTATSFADRAVLCARLTVNNCCSACGAARRWRMGLLLVEASLPARTGFEDIGSRLGPPVRGLPLRTPTSAIAYNSVMEDPWSVVVA